MTLVNKWLYLIIGFVVITSVVYAFSFLIDDKIDWQVLLFLNPDLPIPVVDELVILVTDFSMFVFGLVFFFWEIAYQASKRDQKAKENVEKILKLIGIIIAAIVGYAYFWAGYTYSIIFFPLALIIFCAFWFIGNTITRYSKEKLGQINRLFWITLLSFLLTELAGEVILKYLVARPRPLWEGYAAYNEGIRNIADETVRMGYSYVAGHSSVFFALITPMIWFVSNKQVKLYLFLWASTHAFTRVYLAAHFPYCTLMGSVLGFFMATLVTKIFGVLENK